QLTLDPFLVIGTEMVGKARSSNFTLSEKLDVLELVKPYVKVLEEHTNKHSVIVEKNRCWDIITEQYNALGKDRPARTAQGLRTLYKRLKEGARQELMQRKQAQPEHQGSLSEPTKTLMEIVPLFPGNVQGEKKNRACQNIHTEQSLGEAHEHSEQVLVMAKEEHEIIMENQRKLSLYIEEKREGQKRKQRLEEELLRVKIKHDSETPKKKHLRIVPCQGGEQEEPECIIRYFNVVWCKASKKKHKKWEGDAVLIIKGRSVILKDMEGKDIGRGSGYKSKELENLSEGQTLMIGGKEIEIMGTISVEDFNSGRCFHSGVVVLSPTASTPSHLIMKPFSNPLKSSCQLQQEENVKDISLCKPRHDPYTPNALVMPRPSPKHQWLFNKAGLPLVDVVVDPYLMTHLRPHQKAGVIFLYECIMGMRSNSRFGAILADEMGLGKTLQCIALIWTLLRQGPYGGKPVIKRTLIVTPGSLVKNWNKEFQKWLGTERIKVFPVGQIRPCTGPIGRAELLLKCVTIIMDRKVEEFLTSPLYSVLVISYEMLLRSLDQIQSIEFNLIICDEGHRLKNSSIKTSCALLSLPCERRIILTGTPVQNDLQEFYAIIEFVNPGILGSSCTYRKIYEEPIIKSQQPSATKVFSTEGPIVHADCCSIKPAKGLIVKHRPQGGCCLGLRPPKLSQVEEKHLGEERASELARLTGLFILRRTQPAALQLQLYCKLLTSHAVRSCLLGAVESSPHLVCIGALKKLCNHPLLLFNTIKEKNRNPSEELQESNLYEGLADIFPEDYDPQTINENESGKLLVLTELLAAIHEQSPAERVVLISSYTQTLNLLQEICKRYGYGYARLDGQTPVAQRQQVVDGFNSRYTSDFIFLLSSKAGGVGLNLVGASHLVLYDIDWNPANDIQMVNISLQYQKKLQYQKCPWLVATDFFFLLFSWPCWTCLDSFVVADKQYSADTVFLCYINKLVFSFSARQWHGCGEMARNGQCTSTDSLLQVRWPRSPFLKFFPLGTIEEKIYQRQISKQSLSGAVVDLKKKSEHLRFSKEELRDLFILHESSSCITHDLLECPCDQAGTIIINFRGPLFYRIPKEGFRTIAKRGMTSNVTMRHSSVSLHPYQQRWSISADGKHLLARNDPPPYFVRSKSCMNPGQSYRGSWSSDSSDSAISTESAIKPQEIGMFLPLDMCLAPSEDTYERTFVVDGECATLILMDMWENQDEEEWIQDHCMQVGDAYLIVYSITDRVSFEKASELRIQLRRTRQAEDIPIILVGNKSDLVRCREVSVSEGRACAVVFDCKFIETSAAVQHNVQELFEGIVRQVRLRRDSKEVNEKRMAYQKRRESFPKKARRFLDKIVAKNNKNMAYKLRSKSCHDLSLLHNQEFNSKYSKISPELLVSPALFHPIVSGIDLLSVSGPLQNKEFIVSEGITSIPYLIYQYLQCMAIPRHTDSKVLLGEGSGKWDKQADGWLYANSSLDRESKAIHRLQIKALDQNQQTVEGPFSINLTVKDINDNRPFFNNSTYNGVVRQHSRPGISKTFMFVYATDMDDPATPNAQLSYSILNQMPNPYNTYLFQIDKKTGAISTSEKGIKQYKSRKQKKFSQGFQQARSRLVTRLQTYIFNVHIPFFFSTHSDIRAKLLDPEKQDTYSLLVIVKDLQGLSENAFSDTTKVNIIVKENLWQPPEPISISENSTDPHPIKITQVQWNEPGAKYELGEKERGLRVPFSIDENGNIYVTKPLDREEKDRYVVLAFAKSSLGELLEEPLEIHINVLDINDNPPACKLALTEFEVQENEKLGLKTQCAVLINIIDINDKIPIFEKNDYGTLNISEDTPVGTTVLEIQANDADEWGTGSSEIFYIVTEGDIARLFIIEADPKTNKGYVKIAKPLDFETQTEYHLKIKAENPEPLAKGVNYNSSSFAVLCITVTDVNEAPVFSKSWYQIFISEDTTVGTHLVAVKAKDPEGSGVRFFLKEDKWNWLRIDNHTGDIVTTAKLDREKEQVYVVKVGAVER
uniref:RAD54 homolog B n=1 Tax=Latimeria chalumnae TaxID=7897 RepID=H2ZU90_LATCH